MNETNSNLKRDIDQIHEEHHGIRQQMKIIDQMLENPPVGGRADWASELQTLTNELQATLERHFEFEEKGGFMRTVLEVRPTKSEAVESLLHEHSDLHGQVEKIQRSLAAPDKIDMAEFCSFYSAFIAEIRHHEKAENELLQEVFTQDLGAGD